MPPAPLEVVAVPEVLPMPAQLKPVPEAEDDKPRPEPADEKVRVSRANAEARVAPTREGYVNAIQVWPFTDGALYQVYAAVGRVTVIALQPSEELVTVAAGDTVRWIVGDTSSGGGADLHAIEQECGLEPWCGGARHGEGGAIERFAICWRGDGDHIVVQVTEHQGDIGEGLLITGFVQQQGVDHQGFLQRRVRTDDQILRGHVMNVLYFGQLAAGHFTGTGVPWPPLWRPRPFIEFKIEGLPGGDQQHQNHTTEPAPWHTAFLTFAQIQWFILQAGYAAGWRQINFQFFGRHIDIAVQ